MIRLVCLLCVFLTLSDTLPGQCPGSAIFTSRFNALYNSADKTTDEKLKALLALQEQMKQCHAENDSTFTILLQKTGLLYYQKADFVNAVAYTKRSIQYASAATPNFDSAIVQSYNNLVYYYESLHDETNEYDAIDSCIAYAVNKNTDIHDACIALNKKTVHLFNLGDYRLCAVSASLGEHLIEKYDHDNDSMVFANYFFIFRANVLYFSYKISSVERLLKARETSLIKTHHADYLADVYGMLGRINQNRNDFTQALFYFRKAYQANTLSKYNAGISEDLTNIGMIYAKGLRAYDKGLPYCYDALKYAASTSDSLIAWRNIANIYTLKGQFDKAQYFFRQSFNTLGAGSDETSITMPAPGAMGTTGAAPPTGTNIAFSNLSDNNFNLYQDILDLITEKGNALQQQYLATNNRVWLQAAIQVYKKGDLFLTQLKKEKGLQFQSNLVWRMDAHSLYEQAIRACYTNEDTRNAFYFFERGRAVLLNDQLTMQRSLTNSELSAEAQSDQQINQIESTLQATDSSSGAYLELLKRLYIASENSRTLSRTLSRKKSPFPESQSDTFLSIDVARSRLLKNNTHVLLELFTGDSAVYRLLLSPDTQSLVTIDKYLYSRLVRQFMEPIAHPTLYAKDFQQWVTTANQLYLLLFKTGNIPAGRIIVSPDAGFFPFEALVTGTADGQPAYFLEKYAVSYTYSAGFLLNTVSKPPKGGAHVFGFAPVQFAPYLQLTDLPGSDVSLDHIGGYFGEGLKVVRQEATRSSFLRNFPDYDIIQLYTHAADSSYKNDPVIYFSDSALYLSQLTSLRKTNVQLVVLSACETAKGRLYQGEGVFSFSRSFAALGIPAAISNLWAVDDQSTYRLTELFYKYLADGLTTDVALQQARLEFIRSSPTAKRLPYYWAAAVLTGRSDRLVPPPNNTPYYLFSLLILLLVAGVFILRRRLIASPPR